MRIELTPVSENAPEPRRPDSGAAAASAPAPRATARARGAALLLLGFGFALTVTLAAAGLLAPVAFQGRMMPGVRAQGVALGGLDRAAASERLRPEVAALLETAPRLTVGEDEVAVPASAFGDPEALTSELVARAYARGREGPFAALGALVRAAGGGAVVPLTVPEEERLRPAVAARAQAADREPVSATLVVETAAGARAVRVEPGRTGVQTDVEATAAALAAAFAGPRPAGGAPIVAAVRRETPPAVDGAQLEGARQRLEAALGRPLALDAGGQRFEVERPATLLAAIEVAPASGAEPEVRLVLDTPAFAALAGRVAGAGRAAQNARLEVQAGQAALVPDVPGEGFEPEAVGDAVAAAMLGGGGEATVSGRAIPAAVPAAALAPLHAAAGRALAAPLVVTRGERRWTFGPPEIAAWLALPAVASAEEAAGPVRLDESRLRGALQSLAVESDRPARDARLEAQDGAVRVVAGETGETIDLAATAGAVHEALLAPATGAERTVSAVLRSSDPALTAPRLEPVREQAARLVGAPLTLRHEGRTWSIPQQALGEMLLVGETAGSVTPFLSREKLLERVQPVVEDVNRQLEQSHAAAMSAWEGRQRERREQQERERLLRDQQERDATAGEAQSAPALPPAATPAAADDPQPRRQRVDLSVTAGALWSAASSSSRTVDLRVTTDNPVAVPQTAAVQAPGSGKWIAVNLSAQTLVAYEGDWPVFSGRISSGLPRTPTPVGTFSVFTKLVADDMAGGSYATGDAYFLPKVPYVMYFAAGGYAIHGTYWHNNFGNPMSHGCVNLQTDNARWLFDWAPLGTTVVVHA